MKKKSNKSIESSVKSLWCNLTGSPSIWPIIKGHEAAVEKRSNNQMNGHMYSPFLFEIRHLFFRECLYICFTFASAFLLPVPGSCVFHSICICVCMSSFHVFERVISRSFKWILFKLHKIVEWGHVNNPLKFGLHQSLQGQRDWWFIGRKWTKTHLT